MCWGQFVLLAVRFFRRFLAAKPTYFRNDETAAIIWFTVFANSKRKHNGVLSSHDAGAAASL